MLYNLEEEELKKLQRRARAPEHNFKLKYTHVIYFQFIKGIRNKSSEKNG